MLPADIMNNRDIVAVLPEVHMLPESLKEERWNVLEFQVHHMEEVRELPVSL